MGIFIDFVYNAFEIYKFIILFRIILSWIPHDRYNPIINLVYKLTEPVLGIFRGLLVFGGIDFSPIIIFMLIPMVRNLLISFLITFR